MRAVLVSLSFAVVACGGRVELDRDGPPPSRCPRGPYGPEMVEVEAPTGDRYCMDSTETTNAAYAAWLATKPSSFAMHPLCENPSIPVQLEPVADWPYAPGRDEYPVVNVTFCAAYAFCAANGKRLCGEVGTGDRYSLLDAEEGSWRYWLLADHSEWFNACSGGRSPGSDPADVDWNFGQPPCASAVEQDGIHVDLSALEPVSERTCEGGFPWLFDLRGNALEWENACVEVDDSVWACAARHPGGCGGTTPSGREVLRGAGVGVRCCADLPP